MMLIAGPPGAGKSIQSQKIAEAYDIVWLSMGQLLRQSVDQEVVDIMKEGRLLDDELVERVLSKAIEAVPSNQIILLDGFPRRDSQVKWFLEFIEKVDRDVRGVIHVAISLDASIKRLLERGRLDDKEPVIRDRYAQYEQEIIPMLKHLSHKDIDVFDVDGEQSIDDVYKDIVSAIQGKLS